MIFENVIEQLTHLAEAYPSDENRLGTPGTLTAEVHSVAGHLKSLSLDGQSLNRLIFFPLEEQLIARCGADAGFHLFTQIVRAFRDEGSHLSP